MCYNHYAAGGYQNLRSRDDMEHNGIEAYVELRATYSAIVDEGEQERFISFLRYCAERLEKGDSVQAIWSDYLETENSK